MWLAELCYVIGKAMTYAVLGLLVASLGRGVARGGELAMEDLSPALANAQTFASWLAGGLVLWMGVRLVRGGSFESTALIRHLRGPLGTVQRLFRAALDQSGRARGLVTGLCTGLLPCGLSWGALALCLALDPLAAMVCMFVFGLGTAPGLVFLGLGWQGLAQRMGARTVRLSGLVLILFGLVTILRGAPEFMAPVAGEVLPECCAGEAAQ